MAEKSTSCPDSGSQDDILESLTHGFVHTKSPAIAEEIAGSIDNVASGGLSPNSLKEKVEKYMYPSQENCKFLFTTTVSEEIWDLLSQRCRMVDLAFQWVQ